MVKNDRDVSTFASIVSQVSNFVSSMNVGFDFYHLACK